jgi:hypothetical protein
MVFFLSLLLLSHVSAVEITDPTNDIWYQEKNTQSNKWELKANNLSNYSYIDVTDIHYSNVENFEVMINFFDAIDLNKILGCEIFYGSYSPYQYYRFRYTAGADVIQMTSFGFSFAVNKTISFEFNENQTQILFNTTLPLDDEGFTVWGYTYEYSSDYEKYWADFFPSSYEPTDVDFDDSTQDDQDQDDDVNETDDNQDQNDTNTNNGQQQTDNGNKTEDTPGFGLILLCASMIFFIILGFKRKN